MSRADLRREFALSALALARRGCDEATSAYVAAPSKPLTRRDALHLVRTIDSLISAVSFAVGDVETSPSRPPGK